MSSDTPKGFTCDQVWEMIRQHQQEEILTAKGLPFTYTMKGGELFISRRTKSITRSTFEAAWNKVLERPKEMTGPKKLNVFGAPYLWAIFKRLELVPFGAKNCPPGLQKETVQEDGGNRDPEGIIADSDFDSPGADKKG